MTSFIINIAIGAAVWLVLPSFLEGFVKKKSSRKATALLCKIAGIAIIAVACFNFLSDLFGG